MSDNKDKSDYQTRFGEIRSVLDHENELVNHRLSWMCTLQGLLFAAFSLLITEGYYLFSGMVCFVGFASSVSITYGLHKSSLELRTLNRSSTYLSGKIDDLYKIDKGYLPLIRKSDELPQKTGWCELRRMSASNDNEREQKVLEFQSEFESKKQECAVLIIDSKSALDKWTIAGFNDAGQFNSVLIDDLSDELSVELKKKQSANESKIVELVTSILGRTQTGNDRSPSVFGDTQDLMAFLWPSSFLPRLFAATWVILFGRALYTWF